VSLEGIGAPPDRTWLALSRGTEDLDVAGVKAEVLNEPARALHVALHAAQHGRLPKPVADLRRALEQLSSETWDQAAELARALDAEGAFRAGLELEPGGQELAARLELEATDVTASLRAAGAPAPALGFERLASTPGWRDKLRHLTRVLLPTPGFLRWWTPIAKRGRIGLLLAYPWRYAYLAWKAVPSLIAWWRARR
jgi:hypothetical protein